MIVVKIENQCDNFSSHQMQTSFKKLNKSCWKIAEVAASVLYITESLNIGCYMDGCQPLTALILKTYADATIISKCLAKHGP